MSKVARGLTDACLDHGPKRQPDRVYMLCRCFDLDGPDDGDDDDDTSKREDSRNGYFLLSIDLRGLESIQLTK